MTHRLLLGNCCALLARRLLTSNVRVTFPSGVQRQSFVMTTRIAARSRRERNLGIAERVLRILLGGALAVWALAQALGTASTLGLLLDVALVALGVDFVVTGVRGYCPLYKRLGWSTAGPAAGSRS